MVSVCLHLHVVFLVPSVFACCFLHLERQPRTNLRVFRVEFVPFGDKMISFVGRQF